MIMLRSPSIASITVCALTLLSSTTSAFTPVSPKLRQHIHLNLNSNECINTNSNNAYSSRIHALQMVPPSSSSSSSSSSSTTTTEETAKGDSEDSKKEAVDLKPDSNGVYMLSGKEDHLAFLEENKDQITLIKFFAPWCRACKGLEPKYIQIAKDPKYAKLPIKFAQFSVQHNKEYIKSLGILALPSVHIYASLDEGLVENFPCGPSKVPILKKKIAQVVNERVDPKTFLLKPFVPKTVNDESEDKACSERSISVSQASNSTTQLLRVGDVVVSQETMDYIRTIPFFKDLSDDEFTQLISKSVYSTFEAGSVIMKQGKPGKTFYIIDDGEVEISVKGAFEDPLTTPSGYLGAVVNRLTKKNYFGERSLITGEPRAASIRATEKTRCFTFKVAEVPVSSVLSGKRRATQERLNEINDKYAIDYYDINLIDKQFEDIAKANQVKGSPNGPTSRREAQKKEAAASAMPSLTDDNDSIITLLVRFKLLRQAARCFEYISNTNPAWGDENESYRRSLLVTKLTRGQQEEFKEVFNMIDTSGDGVISVLELKGVLESVNDEQLSDERVKDMINKCDVKVDGNTEISLDEFMGVMAEAEFYYLFKETFATLDKEKTGYVPAYKIDQILCGLRDLISDDRKSIIDVEDREMLIDYETFSRMMIGTW